MTGNTDRLDFGTEEQARTGMARAWEYLREYMDSSEHCALPLESFRWPCGHGKEVSKMQGHTTASAWVCRYVGLWSTPNSGVGRTKPIYVLRSRNEAVAALNAATGEILCSYTHARDYVARNHVTWFAAHCTEMVGRACTADDFWATADALREKREGR